MEQLTMKELAEKSGLSLTRVYKIAQRLGRKPTLTELLSRNRKSGRPNKY